MTNQENSNKVLQDDLHSFVDHMFDDDVSEEDRNQFTTEITVATKIASLIESLMELKENCPQIGEQTDTLGTALAVFADYMVTREVTS